MKNFWLERIEQKDRRVREIVASRIVQRFIEITMEDIRRIIEDKCPEAESQHPKA